MRTFSCKCGNALFFGNSLCLGCGSEVGFDPESNHMVRLNENSAVTLCQNGSAYGVCNWVVARKSEELFCRACSLNRVIPDLSYPENVAAWAKVESAKRRVLFTLKGLGLQPVSKLRDGDRGLVFDLIRSTPTQPVSTGHQDGVITLDLNEADNSYRERQRDKLGEPYRTIIGHMRHEIAHYYWDRFFKGCPENEPRLAGFRELFGDERADYSAALKRYYNNGAPAGWDANFITAYATSHPWEDWAETWAHYLHIIDGSETAKMFGFDGEAIPIPSTPLPDEAGTLPQPLSLDARERGRFLELIRSWVKLSPALNELAMSLGHGNYYPFVLSLPVVRKLCFVHYLLGGATRGGQFRPEQTPKG